MELNTIRFRPKRCRSPATLFKPFNICSAAFIGGTVLTTTFLEMNMANDTTDRPRVFYGWFVVAGTFAITFIGFGNAYSFGAFLPSLQHDFAASRGSVSLVFAIAGFLYFGLGVISGPLADRRGARRFAVIGMILIAIGLALASMARSLIEVYAAYSLGVGLGIGCAYVPAVAAVQRWFVRRRGFASGLAVSGIGVGTLVAPPVVAILIEFLGWRGTYLVLGIFTLVAGVAFAFLIEDDPRKRGLAPDGEVMSSGAQPLPAAAPGVWSIVTSPRFIGLYGACFICAFGLFVPFVHLVPYALDRGIPQTSAVLLIGAIGVGSTAGRFLLGDLADRLGRALSFLIMFIGMGLSFAIWLFAGSFWPLAIFALVFGVFYGGFVALAPAVVIDYFGAQNASTIIGILYTSVAFGTLIGPSAAGYAFDLSHSYTLPIVVSGCAYALATLVLALTAKAPMARS
jgi:MFS transporter, OFA family, oxalate/formate antiporter